MSGMYGADLVKMRELAKSFDDQAVFLDSMASAIDSQLAMSSWEGFDADDFRGQWSGLQANMLSAADALREGARRLRSNADAQEATSLDDGSGGGGGAPVAGSGGTAGGGNGGGGGGAWGPATGADAAEREDPFKDPRGSNPIDIEDGFRGGASAHLRQNSGPNGEWGAYDDQGKVDTLRDGIPIDKEFSAKQTVDIASGKWGAFGSVGGEFGNEDGLHGSGDAEVGIGAKANAEGYAEFKDGKLSAGAEASASAGVYADAKGEIRYGEAKIEGDVHGFAGARGSADASVSVGADGLSANVGFEAFAGAEASASGKIGVDGATVGATVTGYAGVGVKADADFSFSKDKVGVTLDLGVAFGVGAGVKLDISIEPKKVVETIGKILPWNW